MQAFDELSIELLKFGYKRVAFIECHCAAHGAFRFGIAPESEVGERWPCPKCLLPVPCSGVLAEGFTRKPVPFEPEFWRGPGRWDLITEEEYRTPAKKPGKDGRSRHYRKTLAIAHEAAALTR